METSNNKPNNEGLLDHSFFNEDQCMLLIRKLVKNFETKIEIFLPNGGIGLLSIKCTQVFPPANIEIIEILEEKNKEQAKKNSYSRAMDTLFNNFVPKVWVIFAEFKNRFGATKYICVTVVPGIIATYSFQREHEIQGITDPRLN